MRRKAHNVACFTCGLTRQLKPYCKISLIAILLISFFNTALAETSGVLRMMFLDSRTGAAVKPDQVLINGRDETAGVTPGGVFGLEAANGTYEVSVSASGYSPATVTAHVHGADTLVQSVELDPAEVVEEPEVEHGTGVVAGTVVDDESGKLLPGVKLTIPEENVTSESDVRGQFELVVPVPGRVRETLPSRKVSLNAELMGYRPEHRKNVEIFALNRKRYILRLQPIAEGTSETQPLVLDEDKQFEQRYLRGWAFDVGVR